MKDILDELTKTASPTTNYGYYASRATVLLVMTLISLIQPSPSSKEEKAQQLTCPVVCW